VAQLFRLAYLGELFLWIPLAYFVATMPAARRWLAAPLVASVLAAAYEAYMTFVWEPSVVAPIRLDIFLVMVVAGVANAICGLSLAVSARGEAGRLRWWVAAALCLSVPAFAFTGFVFLHFETAQLNVRLDRGNEFRFEAAFRDDDSQMRVFGNLNPGANPWAGYYLAGDGDDRFKHLVINDAGQFWLYHSKFYEYKGRGKQRATDPDKFEGEGSERMDANMKLVLRRQAAGPYLLQVDFGYTRAGPPRAIPIQKTDPPRFAQPPSPGDQVRFVGVFSGTYDDRGNDFWLVQIWLWESKGAMWGRYLHDVYNRGQKKEFIYAEEIQPECMQQCKALSFKSSRGIRTLIRGSDDEFRGRYGSPAREVTLRRGQIVPGFLLDLAPLRTEEQNRAWLDAVTVGHMIAWDVPARR
jgi:hypothetical protein